MAPQANNRNKNGHDCGVIFPFEWHFIEQMEQNQLVIDKEFEQIGQNIVTKWQNIEQIFDRIEQIGEQIIGKETQNTMQNEQISAQNSKKWSIFGTILGLETGKHWLVQPKY